MLLIANLMIAQHEFYTDGFGGFIESNTVDCGKNQLGTHTLPLVDIAVTPNGTFYGVGDSLYLLDFDNGHQTLFQPIYNGFPAIGVGLVGYDDDHLLSDYGDSLAKINVVTQFVQNLGYVGYWCGGDYAFFEGDLYMADGNNHLIKITLDTQTDTITSVTDIGMMVTQDYAVYGLFTTYVPCEGNTKALYAIDGANVYRVNTVNASVTLECVIEGTGSIGAASVYNLETDFERIIIPNVFTPNGDGSNDFFELNFSYQSVTIFNRWGKKVYESKDNSHNWDGKTTAGADVPAGTYYYIIHRDASCGENLLEKGYVTLIR